MKLELSNEADQQSSLIWRAAKIDPHKLHCDIAFVALRQQAE